MAKRPQRPPNEVAGGTRASRQNPYAPVSTTIVPGNQGKPEMEAYPVAPIPPTGEMQILQTQTNNAIRAAQAAEQDSNRMASAFAGLSGTAMGIAELGVQAMDTFMKADRGVLSWQVEEREKMVADLAIANMSWAEMVEKGMIPETMSPNQTRAYMTYEAGRRDREFTTRVNSEMAMMLLDESNHTMDGFMASMHKMWTEHMGVPVGGDEISFQHEMGKVWAKRSFEFGSRHSTWMQGNSKKQFADGIRSGLITDFIQAEGAMEPLHNVPTGEFQVWEDAPFMGVEGQSHRVPVLRKETPEETQERVMQHVLGSVGATIQERWGHLHSFKTMHDEVGKALIDIAVEHPKHTGLALSVLDRLKVGPEGSELNIASRDAIIAYRSNNQKALDKNTKEQNSLTAQQLFDGQISFVETGIRSGIQGLVLETQASGDLFTFDSLFQSVDNKGTTRIESIGRQLAETVSERTGIDVMLDTSRMSSNDTLVFTSLDPRHNKVVSKEIKVQDLYEQYQFNETRRIRSHQTSNGVPAPEAWARAVSETGLQGDAVSKGIASQTHRISTKMLDAEAERAAASGEPVPDDKLPSVEKFEDAWLHWRALSQINPSHNNSIWGGLNQTLSVNAVMQAYGALRDGTLTPMDAGAAYRAIAGYKDYIAVPENKTGLSSWSADLEIVAGTEMAAKPHLIPKMGEIRQLSEIIYGLALSGGGGSTIDKTNIVSHAIAIIERDNTFVGGTLFDVAEVGYENANTQIPMFKGIFGSTDGGSMGAAMLRGRFPKAFNQEDIMDISDKIIPNFGKIVFKPAAGGKLWNAYQEGPVGGVFKITPRGLTLEEWQLFKNHVDKRALGASSSLTGWREGMVDPRMEMLKVQEMLIEEGDPTRGHQHEIQNPIINTAPGDMTPRP